jgi:hypothetical protein
MIPGISGIGGFTAAPAGGGGPPTEWGIVFDPWEGQESSLFNAIAELQMFESTDGTGTNLCSGASASATNSHGSAPPAGAIAGDGTTTFWSSGTATIPNQLKVTLPVGKEVRSIKVTAPADQGTWGYVPRCIRFGYWDSGVFQTVCLLINSSYFTNSQTITYEIPDRTAIPDPSTARYHRLVTLKNFNAFDAHILSELRFRATAGGSDLAGTYSFSTNVTGVNTAGMTDGNFSATYWQGTGDATTPGPIEWVTMDLGVGNASDVEQLAMGPLNGNSTYAPSDFHVAYATSSTGPWYLNWSEFGWLQGGYADNTLRLSTRP